MFSMQYVLYNIQLQVDIKRQDKHFYLVFGAERVLPDQFIGIDDVDMYPEECSKLPSTPPPITQYGEIKTQHIMVIAIIKTS